jgi:hypothetical protein
MANQLSLQNPTLPISKALKEKLSEIKDNIDAVDSFRIPKVKPSGSGLEIIEGEKPVTLLKGVLLHVRKLKQFYAKPFKAGDVQRPDCFSTDGRTPDASVEKPISKACQGCPKNEFGSNSMQSGKACRDLRPLYFLLTDDAKSLPPIPRQIVVSPTSLKSVDSYLIGLAERNLNYRKVLTEVTWTKKGDTYGVLTFRKADNLSPEVIQDAAGLREAWLPVMDSDIVDREPEMEAAEPVVEAKGGRF